MRGIRQKAITTRWSARSEVCGRRGHRPAAHETRSQTHLENLFLAYSRFHLLAGAIWDARPVFPGHWLAFLYGEPARKNAKLVFSTGLSLPTLLTGARDRVLRTGTETESVASGAGLGGASNRQREVRTIRMELRKLATKKGSDRGKREKASR